MKLRNNINVLLEYLISVFAESFPIYRNKIDVVIQSKNSFFINCVVLSRTCAFFGSDKRERHSLMLSGKRLPSAKRRFAEGGSL